MSRRVRVSTPRTKTGCANCRQRRIKCDETEPSCLRCSRSGWTCSGYTQTINAESAVSARAVATRMPPNVTSITQYSLPFKIPGSQEERRALHYFSNFAAADLTGYIPSTFWSGTVLQRCQHDVPIRHAAAALGRVHLEYTTATEGFVAREDSVEAYRRSVKALRNYLGRQATPDRAMVLICSAIFFCFELVRGERRTALRHLRSGLDILNEWQSDQHIDPCVVDTKEELVAVFARMDLQATMFDDGRVPVLQVDEDTAEDYTLSTDIPIAPFESLDEAQQNLFALLHSAFSFLVQNVPYKFAHAHTVPPLVTERRNRLADKFHTWEKRLKLFEYREASESGRGSAQAADDQRQALSTSKLHFRTIRLLLLQCLQDDLMHTAPSFDDEADTLLELARAVLSSDGNRLNTATTGTSRRCFYLHLGIIAPIFLLAMKTTKRYVVETSIDLLQAASGRREGFYDSEEMAQVAKSLAKRQDESLLGNFVSADEKLVPRESSAASLEWLADEVMQVEIPNQWHDEEGRWKGYDRLLALVA